MVVLEPKNGETPQPVVPETDKSSFIYIKREEFIMSVAITGNATARESLAYVGYLEKKYNRKLKTLDINLDGDYADLHYEFEKAPFERIRRSTGYLVGTMDQWNDAKRAEEHDRVKHDTGSGFEKL